MKPKKSAVSLVCRLTICSQRQAGAALAVARPMGEHVARQAGIDDQAAMRAAVAEAKQRAGSSSISRIVLVIAST